MCHLCFVAHYRLYLSQSCFFLCGYVVALLLVTVTLSCLRLVAVLFWYRCHLIYVSLLSTLCLVVVYISLQDRLSVLRSCREYFCTKYTLTLRMYPLPQKGITLSPLPQKCGYLPLPSYWGNLYGNFAHFYYQKLPKFLLKLLP